MLYFTHRGNTDVYLLSDMIRTNAKISITDALDYYQSSSQIIYEKRKRTRGSITLIVLF